MLSCSSVALIKLVLTLTGQVDAWFSSWVCGNIVGNPQRRTIYRAVWGQQYAWKQFRVNWLLEVSYLGALLWHSEAWFQTPLIFNELVKTSYLFVTKEPPPPPPHCYHYPKLLQKQSITIFLLFWKKKSTLDVIFIWIRLPFSPTMLQTVTELNPK